MKRLIFLISFIFSILSFSKNINLDIDKIYFVDQKSTKIIVDDPNVLKVVNNCLIPIKKGKTKVTVYDNDKIVEKLDLSINQVKVDEFDKIRNSWNDLLVGDRFFDPNDKQMAELQVKFDRDIDKISKNLKLDENNTKSSYLTKTYRDILKLAVATMNKNSKYYLDSNLIKQVLLSLDWMKDNKYNNKVVASGNWWDYEIGTPRAINDIMVVFYPLLSNEYIKEYVDIIDRFVPDANKMRGSIDPSLVMNASGANQTDISKVKIIQNTLRKNEVGLLEARKALEKVLEFTEKGDGFYRDGSFIQHDNVAYTGAYGNVLIDGLSQLMVLLENSKYKLDFENISNLEYWIKESFAPIMYKGLEMDFVKGRSISRENTYYASAREVLRSTLRIADVMDNKEFKQLAKSWIIENKYFDHVVKLENFKDMYIAKKILNDDSIKAIDFSENVLKNYSNMDRAVYKNKDKNFAFALSMSSSKIKYYEAMNNENKKGYYTGDGMFYLYNNDLSQYNDDFWPTVDPYSLAGITVEKSNRADSSGVVVSDSKIAGGVRFDDKHGSFAMQLSNFMKNLKANKSYFIMDDKIVFLGSKIEYNSKNEVQTIIDNKKLSDKLKYEIYLDGKKIDISEDKIINLDNVKTIYLKSSDNQSIGYKLLDSENTILKLETREAKWSDINNSQKSDVKKKRYLTIIKNHKKQNDKYGYIIYPNISLDELMKKDDIIVLEHKDGIHAIKDKKDVLMVNVFEKGKYVFNNYEIDDIVSVIIKNNKIALSKIEKE